MKILFSKHFSFEELTDSKNHSVLVTQNRIDAEEYFDKGARLSHLLDSIRSYLGDKPITVNSGFRNEELNKAVGSKSKNSAHTKFEAADITVQGMTVQEVFKALMKASKNGSVLGIRKVLNEGSWLHVEVSTKIGDYRGFFVSNDGNKSWEKIA